AGADEPHPPPLCAAPTAAVLLLLLRADRAAASPLSAAGPHDGGGPVTSVSEAMAPLHAVPAEEIVLGAMMLSQHAATEVMEILTPADFYSHQHARLYSVLVGELAAGRPIDPVSVAHALDRAGLLGTSGG